MRHFHSTDFGQDNIYLIDMGENGNSLCGRTQKALSQKDGMRGFGTASLWLK